MWRSQEKLDNRRGYKSGLANIRMSKLKIAAGIVLIIIGLVLLFISSATIIWGVLLIIFGIGLIVFWKDENTIEERQDLNKRKSK